MGSKTEISWTDSTWNPIIGCSRVSEGCRNCYAETIAGRFGRGKPTVYSGLTQIVNGRSVWTGEIKETRQLLQPLSWRKARRIFVNSMSDLFHENVTDEMRDKIFAVMALCPQHTFQVLTKRPERMLRYMMDVCTETGGLRIGRAAASLFHGMSLPDKNLTMAEQAAVSNQFEWKELHHVWLGVSVENQAAADERIPLLLQTPAAVRFISAEPLLGPVSLRTLCEEPEGYVDSLCGLVVCDGRGTKEINGLDWVICGGESGPHARPMHPGWAHSLVKQCREAGVACFVKQLGSCHPNPGDPKGGDIMFWPEHLRVREFPTTEKP